MELVELEGKAADAFARSTARLNIWHGAVRSGKTIGSILRWLEYVALEAPPGSLGMIGKTERTLRRNILDPIEQLIGPAAFKVTGSEADLFGRQIYLWGAADARAEAKVRGVTLAGLYGDELTTWPADVFRQAMIRLSVDGAKFFGTTNPDGPFHWLKTDYLDRERELDLRAFHFELTDNPSLSAEYIAALESEYVGLWHLRFVRGLWVAAEGAIYDELDVSTNGPHVLGELTLELYAELTRWRVGVDFGTTNPFHAELSATDRRGRRIVVSEWRWDSAREGRQRTNLQLAEGLRAWLSDQLVSPDEWTPAPELEAIYVDPSAAGFLLELRQAGLPAAPANNAVLEGIQYVANELHAGRLLFYGPGCPYLLAELSGYVWDKKAELRGVDQPLKQNDHGPDALRYDLFTGSSGTVEWAEGLYG